MTAGPGTRLGSYEVVALLGQGGMGDVYRATDTRLGRDVALKVLPADTTASPERVERFRREAKALAALDHPGIVTVYSVEEADGVHFLTMQLVDGQPFDRLIPGSGMPLAQIVAVGTALAEALTAAHDKGIVHRDLKPANVMVTRDGRVKVLDFGLAKMAAAAAGEGLVAELPTEMHTREGVVMGTAPYMSPEQVQGSALDQRSDLFSLGVMLYEMATGRRPFQGQSSAELVSAILRDTPPAVSELRPELPADLVRIVRRCLEKDRHQRFQTARDVANELRDIGRLPTAGSSGSTAPARSEASGTTRPDEGFWVAVLPFKHRGTDPGIEPLAEGLTEEIVTGLSRFAYLRVIARSSTSRYSGEALDVRAVGRELGARYVMEGSVRQAGATLRVAVQLVDAASGAHLWADTYDRPFAPESIFALQDELVPRVVSTVADWYGVLPHSMSEAVRSKPVDQLSPYEALLRAFGYYERVTPEEHAASRPILERAVAEAPGDGAGWAMLAMLYGEEHRFGFNPLPDPLGRSLQAARRAVEAAPASNVSHLALAQAHFFRKEFEAFRSAAERAVGLNPLDGSTVEYLGHLLAFAGDWERGVELAERARQLNPNHAAWYWALPLLDAFRRRDYRRARALAPKALMPGQYYSHALFAALYGQDGDSEAAGRHLQELLSLRPDFAATAREQFGKWYLPELVDQLIDGLRSAGLQISEVLPSPAAAPVATAPPGGVAIAVLPFADMSAAKDQEYLCEGMAEEIMNALVRIPGIRVASRSSAFRARQQGMDLPAIARGLSVGHVLEGSVRTAGNRLRVTAQLTDVDTGYQRWSERYDREAADIFALQDDIASGVVEAVKARLAPGAAVVQARPHVANVDAYRHYLRGRHLRYTKNDHGAAVKAFEEAVRLDPSQALSWVRLAEVNVLAVDYGLRPAAEAYAAARAALATAARLQSDSAERDLVEGMIAFGERHWPAAEHALRRSIERQPDHVQALCFYAILLTILGRAREAMPHLQHAREADPLAPYPYAMSAAVLLLTGRATDASAFLDQALAFEPENTLALWLSGLALVAQGRAADGVAALERAFTPPHRKGFIHAALGWALATAGRLDDANDILEDLRDRPASALVSEAWLRSILGDQDAAFRILEQAEREHGYIAVLTGLPGFDTLRGDSRFSAFLARLGLPAR